MILESDEILAKDVLPGDLIEKKYNVGDGVARKTKRYVVLSVNKYRDRDPLTFQRFFQVIDLDNGDIDPDLYMHKMTILRLVLHD